MLVSGLRSSRLAVVKHAAMALGALLVGSPEAQAAAAGAGAIKLLAAIAGWPHRSVARVAAAALRLLAANANLAWEVAAAAGEPLRGSAASEPAF